MSWINARRRRPAAGYAALLLGLVVVALVYGSLTSRGGATQASAAVGAQQDIAAGKDLFQANCSSCHGLEAQGTSQGPSLIGAGAAAVYFQMSTGRMPAKEVGAENERGPVTFSPREIEDIAGYVDSLGGGPAIPTAEQVDPRKGDPGVGEELFSANCAQCHGFAGAGGALTYGKDAPPLTRATGADPSRRGEGGGVPITRCGAAGTPAPSAPSVSSMSLMAASAPSPSAPSVLDHAASR